MFNQIIKSKDGKYLSNADFHTHSCISDGSLTPEEVVQLASSMGLESLALTDHDTMQGIGRAVSSAKGTSLKVVPGMEISTYNGIELHILGFFPNINGSDMDIINGMFAKTHRTRTSNTRIIVEALIKEGYGITMAEVENRARRGVYVSSVYAAAILAEKGYFPSFKEALRFIDTKKSGRALNGFPESEEAVRLIKKFGGMAVLAHPGKINDRPKAGSIILDLKRAGLDGIESYSSRHTDSSIEYFSALANSNGLKNVFGTDFHGAYNPGAVIGVVMPKEYGAGC